ncbi:hypothetical protein [Cupriavidus agavae]|uniref:DUF892 family protein n=1 Tax=Cupriavidus agavae TaxID=1001822 RepID=A0A4Q7RYZ0_9BURK|nr:hypothetical protein [Cupriavidus agavae]RZT39075.1 hypothetical protein EV147_2269 [Cupriavidus agavae]
MNAERDADMDAERDALNSTLARLSLHATQCAEALVAVAAAASDPQIRAVLAHRANLQRCAAAELAARAGPLDGTTPAAGQARRRDTLPPPAESGELPLLRYAAQHAARAAAAYGEVLRQPMREPELRLLLAHYYRGATELQRLLEQRAMEFTPSRIAGMAARRPARPMH